jgi:TonB family protein
MKTLARCLLLTLLALGLTTGRAQTPPVPGYKVVVEISFDEKGAAEDAKIVETDDPSGAQVLNQIALNLAAQIKQPPREENGKPVKFKARAPFNFPLPDDEGPEANKAPKPALHSIVQPVYPENLAASNTPGGAILELIIGADGTVHNVKLLRASHPEFGASAVAAVQKWIFTPAQKDGVAVESRWRIAVNFAQEGHEPDWRWRIAPRPSLGAHTVVRAKLPAPPAAAAPVVPAEKK